MLAAFFETDKGQATRALPDPVLALARGEGVEIQNNVPGRLLLEELIEESAAPDASQVIRVAPEVVEPGATESQNGMRSLEL